MQNMQYSRLIKDYLTFNRMEQRGLFVLAAILFVLLMIDILMPLFITGEPIDFSSFNREIIAFETAVRHADSLEQVAKDRKRQYAWRTYSMPGKDSSFLKHAKPVDNLLIELNKADTFELQRLRGIGPGFASRIIKYRDRLGGFVSKTQVLEVFGMDSARYRIIADHIYADKELVRPVDLNLITFKQLLSHPYFPFEITKAIMIYRKEHKIIKDPEELKSIPGIDNVVFQKIQPYIKVK
jgi:competence protein ComEA